MAPKWVPMQVTIQSGLPVTDADTGAFLSAQTDAQNPSTAARITTDIPIPKTHFLKNGRSTLHPTKTYFYLFRFQIDPISHYYHHQDTCIESCHRFRKMRRIGNPDSGVPAFRSMLLMPAFCSNGCKGPTSDGATHYTQLCSTAAVATLTTARRCCRRKLAHGEARRALEHGRALTCSSDKVRERIVTLQAAVHAP